MSTRVAPFGSLERALMALFVRDLEPLEGTDARIGGDYPRVIDDFYVRIDKGFGRSNSFEGTFAVDLEVFSMDYGRAGEVSGLIESIMLSHGYLTVTQDDYKWIFDDISQNIAPDEIPWEGDDDTFRFVSTYALTSRRKGAPA